MRKHTKCIVDGCECPGQMKNEVPIFAKGYCVKHYTRFRRYGDPNTILRGENSGNSKHPLYKTWANIKARTSNPNKPNYPDYGGRGIKMCERWLGPYGFDNFLEDMGERPENHSLDRKDNNGDYCKENCRWATGYQQNANTRTNNETVGVGWNKKASKWIAYIMVAGKHKHLGQFTNYEDAVSTRKEAEVLYSINM